MCHYCEYTYTLLCSIQYLPLLFLKFLPSTSCFSTAFKTYPYTPYCHTCNVLRYFDALSFSFPFLPSLNSIEYFHYIKHVLHLSLCMIMLVFMYMFIFWIYLPHMRENMLPLSFWAKLNSLNMMSSNCILYFQTTWCHYSLWLSKTPLCIYTTFSWSTHQLLGIWIVSMAWLLWIVHVMNIGIRVSIVWSQLSL
jgi:hypothetical protein